MNVRECYAQNTSYSTTHDERSFLKCFVEEASRGGTWKTSPYFPPKNLTAMLLTISTMITRRLLFMNIFHRRNFLLVTFPDRLSPARSRITVVESASLRSPSRFIDFTDQENSPLCYLRSHNGRNNCQQVVSSRRTANIWPQKLRNSQFQIFY